MYESISQSSVITLVYPAAYWHRYNHPNRITVLQRELHLIFLYWYNIDPQLSIDLLFSILLVFCLQNSAITHVSPGQKEIASEQERERGGGAEGERERQMGRGREEEGLWERDRRGEG